MLGASADYAKAEKSRFWEQDTRPAGFDRRPEGLEQRDHCAHPHSQVTA